MRDPRSADFATRYNYAILFAAWQRPASRSRVFRRWLRYFFNESQLSGNKCDSINWNEEIREIWIEFIIIFFLNNFLTLE